MARICKECAYPVFSGGYCKFHQYLRTDNKKPKPLKRSPISKGKRPRIKRTPLKVSNKPTGEFAMFLEIYEERKDKWRSSLSGKPLVHRGGFMFVNQFAHLLAKGKYPKFRLRKDNIWCITAEEHTLLDQGTHEQRRAYAEKTGCQWEYIYRNIEILKKQYNELQD